MLNMTLLSFNLTNCMPLSHDLSQQDCDNLRELGLNQWRSEIYSTKEKVAVTPEKELHNDSLPIKFYSGITSANISNQHLTLTLANKGLFEQYSLPILDVTEVAYYESGCSEKFSHKIADATKKVKTGSSEWRNLEKPHKISILGFDKKYEFDIQSHETLNNIVIDLAPAIMNTKLTKNTTVEINCVDCDLLESEKKNPSDIKAIIKLDYDFRSIKKSLLESKRNKLSGVDIDTFKTQCSNLGFKVGTTDYGNCILQLNEL